MNRLTKKKARDLIKRELGISATALEKPPVMNSNSAWPYFELYSGNLRIVVQVKSYGKISYVVLTVAHENSNYSVTEYFYSDTLEFAVEATALHAAEDFCDKASAFAESESKFDPLIARARRAYQDASAMHFKA